jgi:hypothetical protein
VSLSFTKLFSSITESTVWRESDRTRITWITMLAMADKHGRVWGSIPGLAARANIPLGACEEALAIFMAPDKYSRTKEHEGRRISEIDGGWLLLNHAKHRALRDAEDRRAYKAEHERKRRAAKRGQDRGQNGQEWTDVDAVGHNAEADTDTEAVKKKPSRAKHEVDPRHTEFKNKLADYWGWAGNGDMPWDASEASKLSKMLKANPTLTVKEMGVCLMNRHKSEDVNTAARPRQWLENLTDYRGGPLDRFKHATNGNGHKPSKLIPVG